MKYNLFLILFLISQQSFSYEFNCKELKSRRDNLEMNLEQSKIKSAFSYNQYLRKDIYLSEREKYYKDYKFHKTVITDFTNKLSNINAKLLLNCI